MIVLKGVEKKYITKHGEIKALDRINLQINRGEFIVVCGPSGSGKTTLLMIIAAMLKPTRGDVFIEQENIYSMSIRNRANLRAENVGFVFQMFHLIPYLNVMENVLLAGRSILRKQAVLETNKIINSLGLEKRKFHKPSELSAGEKQRTAIARAILIHPKIILADEPTGNLDPDNAEIVLRFLAKFHLNGGTVIAASHSKSANRFAKRIIYLQNGRIVNSLNH